MKKIFLFIIIVLSLFSFSYVKAYSIDGSMDYKISLDGNNEKANCESLFGDPKQDGTVANFMQEIFNATKWLVIILCIGLTIVDFVKAVGSDKKDDLAKMSARTLKRVILSLVFFFIPSLINILFNLIGWYGTCGIG